MSIFEYESLLTQKNLFFSLKMTDNLVLGTAGCSAFGNVRSLQRDWQPPRWENCERSLVIWSSKVTRIQDNVDWGLCDIAEGEILQLVSFCCESSVVARFFTEIFLLRWILSSRGTILPLSRSIFLYSGLWAYIEESQCKFLSLHKDNKGWYFLFGSIYCVVFYCQK